MIDRQKKEGTKVRRGDQRTENTSMCIKIIQEEFAIVFPPSLPFYGRDAIFTDMESHEYFEQLCI